MTDQTPDWQWHNLHDENHYRLDELRTHAPLIWALCVGHRTSITIANALAMPLSVVRYELREYKKKGFIHDEQAPASVVWKLDEEEMIELRTWVRAQQRQNRDLDDSAESS